MKPQSTSGVVKWLHGFLLLCLAGALQAEVVVQGHRGARAERPENTLAAFQYALELGVDVLELDLGVSRDDVLMIAHDPEISELCLSAGKPLPEPVPLRSQTLKQLKQLDCGTVKHPLFPKQQPQPGEPMATLDELFLMVKQADTETSRRVTFNIETKIFARRPEMTPGPQHFAELLVERIKAHGLQQRVVIQSFDYRTLKWVKKLAPDIATSQLTQNSFVDLVAAAKSIDADYISPNWESITGDMVRDFQANGLRVAVWTANTPQVWGELLAMGVDEIITDDPAALIRYLQERGLRAKRSKSVGQE